MDQEQRLLDLINYAKDFSFGTLWWVRDYVWKSVIPGFHVKRPKKWHPGCSLGRKNFKTKFQTVPMLHGSHSYHKGFIVKDLSESSAKKGDYGFFALRMFHVAVFHAVGSDPGMEKNRYKPTLTAEEKQQLKKRLIREGIPVYE